MPEPMRVLHAVTHMNRGGLETMIMNYYRHIDRSVVQFDFLEHRYGEHHYTNEITELGGIIHQIPALNPFSMSYLKALDDFFREHKEYKIIHSHLDCMSTYPLKYAKKNSIPVRIAHSHNTSQDGNLKYLIKLYSRAQIDRYATHLFACSELAGKWMFRGGDFQILNNAIEAEKYTFCKKTRNQIRKDLNIENKFVIGHVGRFSNQKNHSFLIDVFNEIQKINSESVLVLAGIGPLQAKIIQKTDSLNLRDKVLFLGLVENVESLMQGFDVFLFPSLYEGLPLSLIEAQAAGLRCVISADVIPGQVKVTNLVDSISLKESPRYWAEKVNVYRNGYERNNTYEQIKFAGYDVNSNAELLQKFYTDEYIKAAPSVRICGEAVRGHQ